MYTIVEQRKVARLEKYIQADHVMVITTKIAADSTVWRRYVQAHWSKLVWRNSRIVALSGVHGRLSGDPGSRDLNLVGLNKNQAAKLINDNAKEVERLNVTIEVVDVGRFYNREEIDEDTLIEVIKEKSPTVIVLTFCHSNNSELKTILANAGVLSPMFLDSQRERISPLVQNEVIKH